LESDEDEIDESSAVYLESLEGSIKTRTNGAMQICASLQDGDSDDSDDGDDDDDEYDETALESFTTPLDGDDTNIDEYEVNFKFVSFAVPFVGILTPFSVFQGLHCSHADITIWQPRMVSETHEAPF
jgi:hypothetical protein